MMFSRFAGGAGGAVGQYGRGFMYNSAHMMPGARLLMMGCGLVVLAIIVIAIIMISKKAGRRHRYSEAIEVLNVRYAKGELTDEEYIRMKNVIRNQ